MVHFSSTLNLSYCKKRNRSQSKSKIKKDGAANSAVFTNLIPVLPVNVSYADFIDKLSIELAQEIPANGVDTITDRKSSFLGGELLSGVHTDQFRKVARQQKFITDYLNNTSDSNKKAGEFLLEELENQFKDALSRLEKNADKEFGKNLNINEDKEIVRDFRSQSERELKMGKPSDVSGGFFTSLIPSWLKWTCDNSYRTFQQGQKAGKDFTKAVLHDGKKQKIRVFTGVNKIVLLKNIINSIVVRLIMLAVMKQISKKATKMQ